MTYVSYLFYSVLSKLTLPLNDRKKILHLSDMTMPENSTNRKLKNGRNGEKRGISFIHLSHLCLQNFAFERNRVSARALWTAAAVIHFLILRTNYFPQSILFPLFKDLKRRVPSNIVHILRGGTLTGCHKVVMIFDCSEPAPRTCLIQTLFEKLITYH